jgi:long-chain acyl-CoA synthetase
VGTSSTNPEKPWLAHYQSGVPEHFEYEIKCLPDFLERSVERFPGKMALNFQGFEITYKQLQDMVERFAACLHHFGVRQGDAVALLLPNVIPCVAAYYAAMRIGAVAVMNNPLYSDRELEHQFNDSGCQGADHPGSAGQPHDRSAAQDQHQANRLYQHRRLPAVSEEPPFPPGGQKKKLAATVKPADDVYRWKPLLAGATPDAPKAELSFDDVAMYQYTGGTTGVSKGVMLTHGNLSRQVQQTAAWFPGFGSDEIMLGALPFFHVFGLTTAMNLAIYFSWGNILIPKPQPPQLLEAISKFRPTFAPLVPTMYIGILQHPDIEKADLTSIKGCFSGSAPLPVEVIKEFEKRTGATIVEGYGLTESSPVTHINPFGEGSKRKVGSIGVPISDTVCRIVDLNDGVTDVLGPWANPANCWSRAPRL